MSTTCSLCAQMQGEQAGDLIAELLPEQPYKRRVVLENATFAVIPSLGALTPGHTLLCPKKHVCSFVCLEASAAGELEGMMIQLRALLSKVYQAPIHVFEHGMARKGGKVVCTIEHAHLHFVPTNRSVELPRETQFEWMKIRGSVTELPVVI